MAVQAARNAIRERDQLRECVKTLEDALRDEWMPCSSLPEDGMEEVFAQTHDGDTLLARCMFDYDADNQPERVWWSINNDQEIYRVARWKTRAALTPNKEKL